MPHFIIDCSREVLTQHSPETIIQTVYDTADASGLFAKGDVKVRINPFDHYTVGGTRKDFIHILGHIMQGRTTEQKQALSASIIRALKPLFPEIPILSIDIRDIDKGSYNNKNTV